LVMQISGALLSKLYHFRERIESLKHFVPLRSRVSPRL